MNNNLLKDKAVYLVGRYQSGCKDYFQEDKFDKRASVCTQFKTKKNSEWKCLNANDLSILLVALESYVYNGAFKLEYYNGEWSVANSDFDKWFSKCDANPLCKGLCLDDKSHEQCVKSISAYNSYNIKGIVPAMLLMVYWAHNANLPQTVEENGETDVRVARNPQQLINYFSSIDINTFILGYCVKYQSLLEEFRDKQMSGVFDNNTLKSWREWEHFKSEIEKLKSFWETNEQKFHKHFKDKYNLHFTAKSEQAKASMGRISPVETKETMEILLILFNFMKKLDERYHNPMTFEKCKEELTIFGKRKSIIAYIIESIEELEGGGESGHKAQRAKNVKEELNKMVMNIYKFSMPLY